MIDERILVNVVLAKQYVHHAGFSGTVRQVVADGYSAVDAMLSALLLSKAIVPSRNHRTKLQRARKAFPTAFESRITRHGSGSTFAQGVEWDRIESFYQEWLDARYDNFEISHAAAVQRFMDAGAAVGRGIDVLASEAGLSSEEFDRIVLEKAFGYEFSAADEAVGRIDEIRFDQAERAGELYGSRLGTKFAETSNYCQFALVSDDPMTQRILKNDQEIAIRCAKLYEDAIAIVELIDQKRSVELVTEQPDSEDESFIHENAPDFFLAIKFRFHGSKTSESAKRWSSLFARGLSSMGREE